MKSLTESTYLFRRFSMDKLNEEFIKALSYVCRNSMDHKSRFYNLDFDTFKKITISVMMDGLHPTLSDWGYKDFPYDEIYDYLLEHYSDRIKERHDEIKRKLNESIVYRGQPSNTKDISPRNSIWVTDDKEFAKEYGKVKKYKLPNDLNILDTDYYDKWEELVDEFDEDGDYDEYKYEPSDEFIQFLISKGYDGFQNNQNILIFDKNLLKRL